MRELLLHADPEPERIGHVGKAGDRVDRGRTGHAQGALELGPLPRVAARIPLGAELIGETEP
jgi:hypothetical protein